MKTYKRIATVTKSIAILRHLAEQREPVSAADVARTMEMPFATAMCHLTTLEDAGMVRKIADSWQLGTGLALFWARTKANLEAEQQRIDTLLTALGK